MTLEYDRKRARTLRESTGLSGRDFAKEIGCSSGFLSDLETGRRHPSRKMIARISKALRVNEETLLIADGRQDLIKARIIELLDQMPESLRAEALGAVAKIYELRVASRSRSRRT